MLLELAPQEVGVGGFAAETVPVLCQHHSDASGGNQITHAVHAWPLQAGTALTWVYHLLEDLIALSDSVRSQSFDLLGERVSAAGLLVGGDAGVEDGSLRAVAVR